MVKRILAAGGGAYEKGCHKCVWAYWYKQMEVRHVLKEILLGWVAFVGGVRNWVVEVKALNGRCFRGNSLQVLFCGPNYTLAVASRMELAP